MAKKPKEVEAGQFLRAARASHAPPGATLGHPSWGA